MICPISPTRLHYGRHGSPQDVPLDTSWYRGQGKMGSAAEERLAWSDLSVPLKLIALMASLEVVVPHISYVDTTSRSYA